MNKKGFTLIELLAVMAVVAVLSVIAVPSILKLYNDSLENSFKTESLAVLKGIDDDISIDYDDINEYDCTKGNESIYKRCSIKIMNGKPVLEAEGAGKFSDFSAYEVSLDGSGYVVRVGKLENYVEENVTTSYSLIDKENNKLSEKFTEQKFSDIAKTIDEVPELKGKFVEFNVLLTGDYSNVDLPENGKAFYYTNSAYINDGKLFGGDSNIYNDMSETSGIVELRVPLFIASFDISNKESGIYQFESQGIKGNYSFMLISKSEVIEQLKDIHDDYELKRKTQNIIYDSAVFSNDGDTYMFGDYELRGIRYNISSPVVTLESGETYYLVILLMDLNNNSESKETSIINQITMTKISKDNIRLKGEKQVLLLPSEVSKYKDAGIVSNNGILKENKNYVSYSNLKKQVGDYNYLYIIKRNDLLSPIVRNIYVVSEKYTDYYKYDLGGYLVKNTDKYKFYCSLSNSYLNADDNPTCVPLTCYGGIGFVRIESTETSYSELLVIIRGDSCPR